jgi:gamma-glutamyltranspeptidase/glutathione hydrolase
MKLAFADVHRYVADPAHAGIPLAGLLDPAYLAARRALIGSTAGQPAAGQPQPGDTVYLCTADRDGMMVSYIQSNYQGFGSGVVIPGTGIALHDRGAGFSLQPGHPNEAAGGKRPFHTIVPAFLTAGGKPVGPFGVMGAHMQPQGHVQVALNTVDYGFNPQAALDAPRWKFFSGLELALEPGIPESTRHGLADRGHVLLKDVAISEFGRGQIIWQLDQGLYAAGSDPRSDGAAVGW